MGIALCAAAVATVLLGAGCQKQGYPSNSGRLDQGPNPAPPSSDATSTLPTQWTEYRSEKLGITIPYPEGWYVEEASDGARFHEAARPSGDTEYPAELWLDSSSGTIDDYLAGFRSGDVLERNEVIKSGRAMQRVQTRHDLYGTIVSYLWQQGLTTLRIGGKDGAVVEYVINGLEVMR
ncbi:hypothetical protein HY634_02995 [Candidatus Uhrbacteria bacterium]|nr:hypothetical protein [Candidatus Uhrbacteria bacterium]